jgi:hypothetical protein
VGTTRGVSWTIKTPVSGDNRLENGTGGTGKFAVVDINYCCETLTSLQTHSLDFSTVAADTRVSLTFNSYFLIDLLESINVDINTGGGTNWTNVWSHNAFNHSFSEQTVDLTGLVAGHTDVKLRFRYGDDSYSWGNLWQIDNVKLEVFGGVSSPVLPGSASNPSPLDGAIGISINANLSWASGSDATSHVVFFNGVSQGNQAGATFSPGTLAYDTAYNWRVDEVNADGTTAGTTWNFTTEAAPVLPGTASNSSPINGATDININANLSWASGSDATSHIVFFNGVSQGNQTGTTFSPGTLTYDTAYNWRVDEVNADGTTVGTTWSFTTETAPVLPAGPASNPNPIDGAIGISINADLSWASGSDATSHVVFFNGLSQGNQTSTTFAPDTLAYDTNYTWRVDEVNAEGTTAGTTWSFSTETTPPSNFSPIASFSYSCKKTVCTFTNTSSDPDVGDTIIESNWDFGGGNTSTTLNPVHDFSSIGEHTVFLSVKDNSLTTSATVIATFTTLDTKKPVKGISDVAGGGSGGDTGGSGPTETGRKCRDGKDNDRDGLIDGEDPDCQ